MLGQPLEKKLRPGNGIYHRQAPRCSTCRLPAVIRNSVHLQITASPRSRRQPGRDNSAATMPCRRVRLEGRTTLQPIGEPRTRNLRTADVPRLRFIPVTFLPWNAHRHPTREMQRPTRDTSNNSKNSNRSRTRNGRSSSSSRRMSISGWQRKMRTMRESNRRNRSTNNRRSNCSKDTYSSNNSCSSDRRHRAGLRPSLQRKSNG